MTNPLWLRTRIAESERLREQGWPLSFYERDQKLSYNRTNVWRYEDAGSWWVPPSPSPSTLTPPLVPIAGASEEDIPHGPSGTIYL
ncbi:MAG: hypothetical protein [Cressdnaviricota sp.]|nr:MAG: hypothetical protein [Cressdnaviricota sp.]